MSLGMCGLRSGRFGALPMCLLALGLAFGAQPWWLLSALFVQPLFSESSPLIPLVGFGDVASLRVASELRPAG